MYNIHNQVAVSEWCGVAATMNPVGRGYGGRRTLPPALERVMRPVAMVQPPGDQLATHLLAARSIPTADALAKDLNNVFRMARSFCNIYVKNCTCFFFICGDA